MPRIRCLYLDCNFLDGKYCSAPLVEIDPDLGCATYVPMGEEDLLSDNWEEEDDDGYESWNTEELDITEDLDIDEDDADFSDEEDW